MSDPQNAAINADGFRFYQWTPPDGSEPTNVLSVTSIRKLCGEPFTLVNWQLANIIDVAMSTVKREVIGPRGGRKMINMKDEFPGEFARRLMASDGAQPKLDDLRKWLREQADSPRNIAAMRGTMVHEAIEKNVAWDRIERPYVEAAFQNLSARDRARAKAGVQDEDVTFVRAAVRNYWAMRREVPFIIVAREVQVFNLTAGYAGSFDALAWMVPKEWGDKPLPKAQDIDLVWVQTEGGGVDNLVLLDWKTSKGVYTDQVVQCHAYLSAEFVGSDGVIDSRLTDLLVAARWGGLVHIRPDGWGVHLFEYEQEVVLAFLGSVAFARFLAKYPEPKALFQQEFTGSSSEEDE